MKYIEIGVLILLVAFCIYLTVWISKISQVKKYLNRDYESYGWASFKKFKNELNKINWEHKKDWKYSLFLYVGDSCKLDSQIHADIFSFHRIGMIMKTPIDYWRANAYIHKYVKEHFKDDLNSKNNQLYKWE